MFWRGAVAVACVIAVETGIKLAGRWTAVLVVAAWTMDQFSSGGGNQGDGGGGGDADKEKEHGRAEARQISCLLDEEENSKRKGT